MTHASVFSGIGGPEVAATMLGWENLFHCEINPFGRAVLDYWYPNAKSYEDITTTDFSEWRGKVNVLTGGFPCQPFSYAGQRRGATDDRYLWPYMFRCIDQIRPDWVVAENVAGILTMVEQGEVSEVANTADLFGEDDGIRGYRLRETFTLQRICDDLEGHGYSVQPILIPACAVGAPHRRDRVFIVGCRRDVADTDSERWCGRRTPDGWKDKTEREQELSAVFVKPERPRMGKSITYPISSGTRTPRTSGGTESDGRDTDKQSELWGAETEWNHRFYELLRYAADTDCHRGNEMDEHMESQQSDGAKPVGNGGERNVADTTSERPQTGYSERETCKESRDASNWTGGNYSSRINESGICGSRWSNFPTVSPVHRGNDGIPFPLDGLTLSSGKWRTEALKAYGNAIVPQVMYEIFRAIEIVSKG